MTARILSVNVTEPRTILLRGREEITSIYKRPVDGPIDVDASGLVGERRIARRMCDDADHALYFYPREHYPTWQRELGEAELPNGYFGENLTCEGLLEHEVRVGDVLRCGGVVAQVCQPRLPCARLDARTGRRFAGRFLRSRRVGFFARVLTPGAIAAGDPIELVRRDGGEPSIDDLLRLTQLEAWDAEGLAHLLLSRHLPAAWRELIEHKAELAQRAEGWHGLRPLELVERRVEAPDVASLWLACPYRRPLPPYRPGQYLTVTWRLEPEDGALRRSYVLTGEPERADRYRITVARTAPGPHPPGVVSTAMLDELAPGARLLAAAPRGSFTLDEVTASSRGVLVLSEGIGVASALPLLRERRRRLPEVPAVHLHVDRDPARFALQDELAALDEPAGESPSFAPARRLVFGHEPAPPAALLRKLVAAAEHVFLAGPKSFTEEVTAALEGLVELVHGAPDAALGGKAAGARLRVESHG